MAALPGQLFNGEALSTICQPVSISAISNSSGTVSSKTRAQLFAVQACLRGTSYTDKSGVQRGCGEASLAVLAAYINHTKPLCAHVVRSAEAIFVSCYASIGSDRLDLANLLISSGFAFASLDANGLPHHAPYAVTEQMALKKRAGLWQFSDVQHPAILLGQATGKKRNGP